MNITNLKTSWEVRKLWNEFRLSKQHAEAKPVSLVASSENKSVLFNVAGMQQFVPYLVGKPHPLGQRLHNIQRCIRTNDIEDIGDERHLSMFEMMGNWSLGDYFKTEALTWTVEFLVDVLWIPKHRLGATIFAWDEATGIPRDTESYDILKTLGIDRISELWFDKDGDSDNFWTPGAIGPCGPCCEFYYDRGIDGQIYIDPITGDDMASDWDIGVNDRYTEIRNNVFMAYYQDWSGNGFTPLSQTNVDTGMWFERLIMVLQNTETIFETDLFMPIIHQIEELTHTQYTSHLKAYRIILDHLRASVFLVADGVTPSNEWRWYILRRLIRRAYYYIGQLSLEHGHIEFIRNNIVPESSLDWLKTQILSAVSIQNLKVPFSDHAKKVFWLKFTVRAIKQIAFEKLRIFYIGTAVDNKWFEALVVYKNGSLLNVLTEGINVNVQEWYIEVQFNDVNHLVVGDNEMEVRFDITASWVSWQNIQFEIKPGLKSFIDAKYMSHSDILLEEDVVWSVAWPIFHLHSDQLQTARQILGFIQVHYKLDYPHIAIDPVSIISECIKFQRTLDQGRVMLADIIAKTEDMIDGETVFKLYDTYGFPSELTIEIAWHNHKSVDQAWFESALSNAKDRSRANANFKNTIDWSKYLWWIPETKFVWYDRMTSSEFAVLSDFDADGQRVIVLDQTVFYPEMGWQRGDSGSMMLPTGEQVTVTDTIKFAGVILHLVE